MTARLIALFLIAVFIFSAVPVRTAQAENFLEKYLPALFPPKDAPPGPEETLQAPFSDSAPTQSIEGLEWRGEGQATEVSANLGTPHLANHQVGEQVVTNVSEALTFDKEDYITKLAKNAQMFSPDGHKQYQAFLRDNNLLAVLESKKFLMRSFVRQAPILLNEGPVEGRYRWLYEIPMMISYMDRAMTGYKESEPVSQGLILRIQVGRVKGADGTDGILIETWDGKLEKLDKLQKE